MSEARTPNKVFMQLRGLVLNLPSCFKRSLGTGDTLQPVGLGIPLRCIAKPS
jgi:hypothetical protein